MTKHTYNKKLLSLFRIKKIVHFFVIALFTTNLSYSSSGSSSGLSQTLTLPEDPHTNSNPNEAVSRHLDLNLQLDFTQQKILGSVTHTFQLSSQFQGHIDLDIDQHLTVKSVELIQSTQNKKLLYQITQGKTSLEIGKRLVIYLKAKTLSTQKIKITYESESASVGTSWVNPEGTLSKKPFMFSLNEPIGARGWIPCQDSPQVKTTFNANIQVMKDKKPYSDLLVLMTATNPTQKNSSGFYHFEMDKPIPSYLIALAAGDLRFKSISKRTGVYAEASLLEKAAHEFEDLDRYLTTAESLYGPYVWGRYDILVTPHTFPYGAMENPMLTFTNPNVIVGDKSMAYVPIHELTHSWAGNLVSNASWNDFWINEGINTYLEHRITEEVYGDNIANFNFCRSIKGATNNNQQLTDESPEALKHLHFASLVNCLDSNESPNDLMAINNQPYGRGGLFLYELSKVVGKTNLDQFLKDYFTHYQFQSVDTDSFIQMIRDHFSSQRDPSLDQNQINLLIAGYVYDDVIPNNTAYSDLKTDEMKLADKELSTAKYCMRIDQLDESKLLYINNLSSALKQNNIIKLSLSVTTREQVQLLIQCFDILNHPNAQIQLYGITAALNHQLIQPNDPIILSFIQNHADASSLNLIASVRQISCQASNKLIQQVQNIYVKALWKELDQLKCQE
jgi:hypothetical protein